MFTLLALAFKSLLYTRMATIRLDIFVRSTLDDLFFDDFDSWCFDERFWVFFSFRNWPQRFDEFSYIFVNSLNCSQTFLTNDNLTYFLWNLHLFSFEEWKWCFQRKNLRSVERLAIPFVTKNFSIFLIF